MASLMGVSGGFGQRPNDTPLPGGVKPQMPPGTPLGQYFGGMPTGPRPIDPNLVDPARPYQPPSGFMPSPWSQQHTGIPPEWQNQFSPQMLQDIRARRAAIRAMPGWQSGQLATAAGSPMQPRPPIAGLLGVM